MTTEARTALPPVRERLLAEASRLFAESGYDAASVQQVVEAAGVTKGAFYHYFNSKDDLLAAIYFRLLALQTERLEEVAHGPGPVEERLRAAAADVVVTSVQNFDDATVFFRSAHLLGPEQAGAVRARRRHYHETFRAMIEEGQRSGVFRDAVTADVVTHAFFGGVHHLDTWYHPDGPMDAATLGEKLAELLLASLRPQT